MAGGLSPRPVGLAPSAERGPRRTAVGGRKRHRPAGGARLGHGPSGRVTSSSRSEGGSNDSQSMADALRMNKTSQNAAIWRGSRSCGEGLGLRGARSEVGFDRSCVGASHKRSGFHPRSWDESWLRGLVWRSPSLARVPRQGHGKSGQARAAGAAGDRSRVRELPADRRRSLAPTCFHVHPRARRLRRCEERPIRSRPRRQSSTPTSTWCSAPPTNVVAHRYPPVN